MLLIYRSCLTKGKIYRKKIFFFQTGTLIGKMAFTTVQIQAQVDIAGAT